MGRGADGGVGGASCNRGRRVKARDRKTLRFAVGTPSAARSSVWRLWVNQDDVYLGQRATTQFLKVSLHASGDWRIA